MNILEIARRDYPHLAKIWLSDVCTSSEIDLLIGGRLFVEFTDRQVRICL